LFQTLAGICAAIMTAAGVIGAAVIGVIVGRTKQFSTTVKLCYVITTAGLAIFCGVSYKYIVIFLLFY